MLWTLMIRAELVKKELDRFVFLPSQHINNLCGSVYLFALLVTLDAGRVNSLTSPSSKKQ